MTDNNGVNNNSSNVIDIRGLTKTFMVDGRAHTVLQDLNLTVPAHEITVLLGRSGCGVLFVTHSIDEALAIGHRIVILEDKKVKKVYPIAEAWRKNGSEEERQALRQDILDSIQN